MSYFPFLRGKQNELFALRELAAQITQNGHLCPIIEPVNDNSVTLNSFDLYVEIGMPFLFIANPKHGNFEGKEADLHASLVAGHALSEYDNYIPALYIYRDTTMREVNRFRANYGDLFRAVIYCGEPQSEEVRNWCSEDDMIYHHVLLDGTVQTDFAEAIPEARRVIMQDPFRKQVRNSDYPPTEFFTDMNTPEGNPRGVNWGDYSTVGDNFIDGGGPPLAVAIHHIHYAENGNALNVSHFLSNRQQTTADTPGKIIEAVNNLVANLPNLAPNDTEACDEYRQMAQSGRSRGLGYLKRLSIRHHLEVILQ